MEERFENHREFLVDRIDSDFGLLDKLLASRTLTREVLHKIKLKGITPEGKNRILLDFVLKNKKANELVSALMDSGQTHLVNYLNVDGVSGFEFGDDWPLNESDISRLEINRESLVDLLDTSDLCVRLFSRKVMNNRQRQFICSKPTDAEKNEALLDILTKCSLRQYKKTIDCMIDSNQSHIAGILSEGGVVVRVHANIEGAMGDVDEMEDEIISQFTKTLENLPLVKFGWLLELIHQRVIAARKGHSVVIYFHCITYDELLQLIDQLMTEEMSRIVEKVFAKLLSIGDAMMITLTWSQDEFRRSAAYFDSSNLSLSRDMSTLTVTNRTLSTALVDESRNEDKVKISELEAELSNERRKYEDLVDERRRQQEENKVKISELEAELSNECRKYEDLVDERRRQQEELEEKKHKLDELKKKIERMQAERRATSLDLMLSSKHTDAFKIDELPEKYKLDPVLVETIRTESDEDEKAEIQGLTVLDKELFVVSEWSSEVEVYDSMEFNFSRRWNLKELIDPFDIGSCNRNKCLYICDYKSDGQSNEILRVDTNGKLINNWSTGSNCGGSLSITDESNVILTVYFENKLNEYLSDGQLIREINLSSEAGIRFPRHAVKLANGHFVVSHSDYGGDLHRVCIVDADGKLKKSFGGKCGSTIKQMIDPVYLAVDGNGYVMVADLRNSRVLLLDSDLKFVREFLSEETHGLGRPWKILLDESLDRLFVAENDAWIVIFQLQ